MVKHINDIKVGQFFEAFQAQYYKQSEEWSIKIHSNGSTRKVKNAHIGYVIAN